MEHFSFVCECDGRFCNDCRIDLFGLKLCRECAQRHWTTCGWCDKQPLVERFPDGTGACADCFPELKKSTRKCPKCTGCGHRYWVSPMDAHGEWFLCSCGLKISPRNPFTFGALVGREQEAAAQFAPRPRTATLFQPAGYSDEKTKGDVRWDF
jgi:hypothetical protein